MLKRGALSPDLYEKESERGAALISYLGKGSITLYDLTRSAFDLQRGDTVLLTTDGLPRALSDQKLCEIMTSEVPTNQKADRLISQIRDAGVAGPRDNATLVIIDVI